MNPNALLDKISRLVTLTTPTHLPACNGQHSLLVNACSEPMQLFLLEINFLQGESSASKSVYTARVRIGPPSAQP